MLQKYGAKRLQYTWQRSIDHVALRRARGADRCGHAAERLQRPGVGAEIDSDKLAAAGTEKHAAVNRFTVSASFFKTDDRLGVGICGLLMSARIAHVALARLCRSTPVRSEDLVRV